MKKHVFWAVWSVALLVVGVMVPQGVGREKEKVEPQFFYQTNEDGFGDYENSYPWSMVWFKGKLYVGTNRDILCLMRSYLGFPMEPEEPDPDYPIECNNKDTGENAEDPLELDLRAEIWCYTPSTRTWERVYKSPMVWALQPDSTYAEIARDVGYRSMVVWTEKDSTQSLYVLGSISRNIPGSPPPRILRTTDGENFTEVEMAYPEQAYSYRGVVSYKGYLYIAYQPLEGPGGILRSDDPASGEFEVVGVYPMGDDYSVAPFEMEVFNGYLYVGMFNPYGYEILKTDGEGVPHTYTSVVVQGGYRGGDSEGPVSLYAYKGYLYVGSGILFGGYDVYTGNGPAPAEVIRIRPDDSWQLVCGRPRDTPDGYKVPISGMSAGFGNPFTGYIWRMTSYRDSLYVGTLDNSLMMGLAEGDSLLAWGVPPETVERIIQFCNGETAVQGGFDLWRTGDGITWKKAAQKGFRDQFNYGVRTFAPTPIGLFVGAANPFTGAEVWLSPWSRPDSSFVLLPMNHAPTADPGGPYTGVAGEAMAFDGSGSSDADGDALVYTWDFGDGGTASGVNPTHTYLQEGTFTVSLTVDDGRGGTDTQTTTAEVAVAQVMTVSNTSIRLSQTSAGVNATAIRRGRRGRSRTPSWVGTAEVTVVQVGSEIPQEGTVVTGNWDINGTVFQSGATGITHAEGVATVFSTEIKARAGDVFRFTVTDVAKSGWAWDNILQSGSQPVGLAKIAAVPSGFWLGSSRPNPFNASTHIPYAVPVPSDVTLSVYTLGGQKVATWVFPQQEAGSYEVKWDASGFANGVYLYRLEAGAFVDTKSMVLLK